MARRALDLEILRKERHWIDLHTESDPADLAGLRDYLRGWLTGDGWDKGRWREFELVARAAGEGKILARVRA